MDHRKGREGDSNLSEWFLTFLILCVSDSTILFGVSWKLQYMSYRPGQCLLCPDEALCVLLKNDSRSSAKWKIQEFRIIFSQKCWRDDPFQLSLAIPTSTEASLEPIQLLSHDNKKWCRALYTARSMGPGNVVLLRLYWRSALQNRWLLHPRWSSTVTTLASTWDTFLVYAIQKRLGWTQST